MNVHKMKAAEREEYYIIIMLIQKMLKGTLPVLDWINSTKAYSSPYGNYIDLRGDSLDFCYRSGIGTGPISPEDFTRFNECYVDTCLRGGD